jgi:hypothetical protein
MIIRPYCKRNYVLIPNSLLNDTRLGADTRGMLALLLSKPRGWVLRPVPLRKQLSREGETPVGWTRLRRMFAESTAAGYMARSQTQAHNPDGTWDKFEYFVGMPDDVRRAVQKAGVAILPQPPDPHEGLPQAQNDFTSHKEQTLQKTDSIKESVLNVSLPSLGAEKRNSNGSSPRRLGRAVPGQEVVQHRLALRLGGGDVARGWLLLGSLSDRRLDALTAQERAGRLTDEEVLDVRNSTEIAGTRRLVR